MLIKKFHTLMIPFPEDLHREIFGLYKELSKKHPNQYLNEKTYLAHITIGTLCLKDEETQHFVEACSRVVEGTKEFDVVLSKLTLSKEQKYIFLDFEEQTKKNIFSLREFFLKNVKNFKIEIPDKYLEKWETYNEEEKKRLKVLGSPYEYEPHLSIAKFEPDEALEAFNNLDKNMFVGKSFPVTKFVISGESEDLENQYPVLRVIEI